MREGPAQSACRTRSKLILNAKPGTNTRHQYNTQAEHASAPVMEQQAAVAVWQTGVSGPAGGNVKSEPMHVLAESDICLVSAYAEIYLFQRGVAHPKLALALFGHPELCVIQEIPEGQSSKRACWKLDGRAPL